jgi:hypothetical protein
VAKVKGRLAANKQRPYNFHIERFNLKNSNEAECKEKYCTEVSNRLAALEGFDVEGWILIVLGKQLEKI